MSDPQRIRLTIPILVHELIRYPVAQGRYVPTYVNRSGLELTRLEGQPLAGLRSDPIRDVVFTDGRGIYRRPAEKILVPQVEVSRQVIALNVAPIVMLKLPERFLVYI